MCTAPEIRHESVEAMRERKRLEALAKSHEVLLTLRPAEEWDEANGPVLWWHLPVCEAPTVGPGARMGTLDLFGKPTECRALQEQGWLTHWSPLPNPRSMKTSDGAKIR